MIIQSNLYLVEYREKLIEKSMVASKIRSKRTNKMQTITKNANRKQNKYYSTSSTLSITSLTCNFVESTSTVPLPRVPFPIPNLAAEIQVGMPVVLGSLFELISEIGCAER